MSGDHLGDAFFGKVGNQGSSNQAPAFLDILDASFTISDTLTFTVDVAGTLDALPNPSGSGGIFFWHFPLNTDNSTDPPGFPVPPGQSAPADFFADALWDGTSFSGIFVDRRPELTGGSALEYSIPVSVSGTRIILTVPAPLAAQVLAAVVLPGATWNCFTAWNNNFLLGDEHSSDAIHDADTINRQPWPQ